jgi:PAS domain-containing protein
MPILQKLLKSSLPIFLFAADWLLCFNLDRFGNDLSLAPFFSLVCFFVLSLYCGPWVVLLSIPPFAALTYWLITPLSPFSAIRTITLVAGGVLAAYASFLRIRAEQLAASRGAIFSLLPIPVLISDPTSKIIEANDAAARLLKYSRKELLDFSWFNLLLDSPHKRADMESYIKVGQNPLPSELSFIFVGKDNVQHNVSLVAERMGSRINLITTFREYRLN